jgi:hypothetical protein
MPSYPIPSCPATITPPNANGFGLEQKKHKVGMRTEMGSTRYRVMNTSNVYVVNAEFHFFTTAKFVEFLTWLKYETNYGNLWFKADWFDAIGFTAGDWIFKFVELPFSNTGYSQTHNATLLMAPYNDNVVSGNYTEIGMGGDFIDSDFPFGFEMFQFSDPLTFNRIAYADQDSFLRTFDFNETNWTKVGSDLALPDFNFYSLTYLSEDFIAYIDKNSLLTGNYGGAGAKLQAYKFNGTTWSTFGNSKLIGAGDSVEVVSVTSMNDTRVAVCYSRTAFFGSREVKLATYDFDGLDWNLVGSIFTVVAAGTEPSLTKLTSSMVALTYITTGLGNIGAFTFNGSTWSLTGSLYSSATINSSFPDISAMTSTTIAFANSTGKLRYFTFSGSAWTLTSAEFAGAGRVVAAISSDKVAIVTDAFTGSLRTYKLTGLVWTQEGNALDDNIGFLNPQIAAFYEY